jgi:uncharacterized protein (DUF697 family)
MATETVINRPAPFVEDIGKKLSEQALGLQNVPVVTTGVGGITRATGETDQGFADRQNAARAFEVRQQNLAGIAPQVAGQDALQQEAQKRAVSGLGSFEPFVQRAEQQAGLASGLGTVSLAGLGLAGAELSQAGSTFGGVPTGPMTTAQTQQYMSPYQSQVIDASLAEFDRNTQIQQQQIRDQQTALGALGSGRAGVQLAEFGTGAARERALLQAGLLQQGFGQAQQARQQDIQNRFNLGQAQAGIAGQRTGIAGATQGLGQFRSGLAGQQAQLGGALQGLQGTDISRLGQLGALNQAQEQARLDATREATRMAAFQPQEELNRFADITTGIMGGMRGSGTTTTNVPNPTPLQTALGIGSTIAGVYGALGGKPFA